MGKESLDNKEIERKLEIEIPVTHLPSLTPSPGECVPASPGVFYNPKRFVEANLLGTLILRLFAQGERVAIFG